MFPPNDPNTITFEAEKSIRDPEVIGSLKFVTGDYEVAEQWNAMSLEEKAAYEKKLVRKLDWKLVPWLTLLYLISFLDRSNIGNAKIQGVLSSHRDSLLILSS
jgi:hypothetical protein